MLSTALISEFNNRKRASDAFYLRLQEEKEYDRMNPTILIRDERPDDAGAITVVTVAAFKTLAISQHTEPFIVEALRAAKGMSSIGSCTHLP